MKFFFLLVVFLFFIFCAFDQTEAIAVRVNPETLCQRLGGTPEFSHYTGYKVLYPYPETYEKTVFKQCLGTNGEKLDVSITPEQKECETHGVWVEYSSYFNGKDWSHCRDYTNDELLKFQRTKKFEGILKERNIN